MVLVLTAFGVTMLVELLIWTSWFWRLRMLLAILAIVLIAILNGAMIVTVFGVWTLLLFALSIFRVVHLLRIVQRRMHEQYLRRATQRTGLWLIVAQAFIIGLWELTQLLNLHTRSCWIILAGLQVLFALMLVGAVVKHLRTTRMPAILTPLADKELPTLTVAIPARNETDDLKACLTSVVASNYPKLEVIVLDDCSQNKRTPEIIKSFAQSGVRFVPGVEAEATWLPKNLAYERLSQEASGEYILFAGVDTRFEPNTLRMLVSALLQKHKSMISVIPYNSVPNSWHEISGMLIQPMRYAWELGLPRRTFNRPAVLSTCWLISRKVLESAGGFAAVSRSIVPESFFARVAAVHDGYSFMRSSEEARVDSIKKTDEQQATAIRTRYPQLHRRPELVAIVALSEFLFMLLPYLVLATTLIERQHFIVMILSALSVALLSLFYVLIGLLTYRKILWLNILLAPLAVIADLVLLHYSMCKYEFSEVSWKGRNVCIPVMHTVPHLPTK